MKAIIIDILCIAILGWLLYHGTVWAVLASADVIDAVATVVF